MTKDKPISRIIEVEAYGDGVKRIYVQSDTDDSVFNLFKKVREAVKQ